jgi:hypothetical protein
MPKGIDLSVFVNDLLKKDLELMRLGNDRMGPRRLTTTYH